MSSQPHAKIYLLLIGVIFIWGISWPINKIGLAFISPLWFAALRLSIGAIAMFIVVIALKKFIIPTRKDLPILLVIGLLQITIFMLCINVGLEHVNAGRSAILVYTTPLWVMPLAVFIFKEKASRLKWLGFILGIIGVIVLFNPAEIDWSDHQVSFGNGTLIVASFSWAIAILCSRNMKWHHTPLELISWQLLIGAIILLVAACWINPTDRLIWNMTLINSLLFSGIFATAFAYWGATVISKELPSTTASLSFLAVPVIGLIFSTLILHEPITPTILFAMLTIIAGIVCVAFSSSKRTSINKIDARID